jgi:lysophospholipid acyltransferase (LPLAT)-like uncharacterized protein
MSETKTRFTRRQRLLLRVLPWLAAWFVRLLCVTLRFRVEGWEHHERYKNQGKNLIYCFWHNQILYATYFFRARSIVVMSSDHFDGEITTRLIKRFGYLVAKGSSTHRAVKALLELKRRLEEGLDVAFTADGPKGPIYQVKPGPVWLSQKTGAAVLGFHIQPEAYWRINSWDGFRVPKPFTRVLVRIAPGFVVPPDDDEAHWVGVYQQELDRLKDECEGYWDRP